MGWKMTCLAWSIHIGMSISMYLSIVFSSSSAPGRVLSISMSTLMAPERRRSFQVVLTSAADQK